MKTVFDTYTEKRFRYNEVIIVTIDDVDYHTPGRFLAHTATWIHPSRLTLKTYLKFNPGIDRPKDWLFLNKQQLREYILKEVKDNDKSGA